MSDRQEARRSFECAGRYKGEATRSRCHDSTERPQRKKHHRAEDREADAEQRETARRGAVRASTHAPHPSHTDGQWEAEHDDENDEQDDPERSQEADVHGSMLPLCGGLGQSGRPR